MAFTGHWSVVCIVLVIVSIVACHPVENNGDLGNSTDGSVQQRLSTSLKIFGDATHFLRTWFHRLRSNMRQSLTHRVQPRMKRSDAHSEDDSDKPEIKVNSKESNESSFETYEKMFLINQTLNYLKQIYYYSEYREKMRQLNSSHQQIDSGSTQSPSTDKVVSATNVPNDTNRVDALLNAKMEELNNLPLSQLENIFHNVRRAAKTGVEDPGIATLCCPQG